MAIRYLSGQTIDGTLTVSGNVQGATFNGFAINSTGTNNVANQIVRTESNGYVNFGWINSVSGNHTGSITRITASNDAYLRYVTPAQFRTGVTDGYYAPSSTVSGVTSVATGNGLTGGTIISTGTLSMSGSYTGNFSVTGNVEIAQTGGTQLKIVSGDASGSQDVIVDLVSAFDYRGRGILYRNSNDSNKWFSGVPYNGGGYSIGYDNSQPEYKANSKLFVASSGNVGIGTTSPGGPLHVKSNNTIVEIESSGNLQNSAIGFTTTTDARYEIGTNISGGTNFELYDRIAGTARISFMQGGTVGIGTLTPVAKLEVAGSLKVTAYTSSIGASPGVSLGYNSASNIALLETWDSKPLQTRTYGYQSFHTNGVERMRILGVIGSGATAGNVGIGTDAPSAKLDVNGSIVSTGVNFINQSNQYNNSISGIAGYGNIAMDSTVSYYDTGKNIAVAYRGIVWTGKYYIITTYNPGVAYFYDNNFDPITNSEQSSVTLPNVSGIQYPHGGAWDGRYLYCIQYSPATIVVYDLDNGTGAATIVNSQALLNSGATYDIEYAEGHLYTCTDGKVSKYKVEGKTITHVFTSGDIAGSIEAQAITYDGSYLWITQNGASVYKVTLDCALVATITINWPPNNTGWAWNGQNIAAANYSTGDVYIINTAVQRWDSEKFQLMGGNVGINTTSPSTKLSINDANYVEMATFTAAPNSTAGIVANNSGYVTGFTTSATHQSSNTALFVPVTDGIKITKAGLLQITTAQDFRSTTTANYAQVDIYKNTTAMFYSLRTNSNSQWDMLNSSGTMIVAANDVIKFRYAAGDFLSMDTGAWSQYSFVWTSR